MPKFELNYINRQKIIKALPELFDHLKKSKTRIIIAFNEFQELAGYEEDKAEAYVRTIMQDCPEITFIFSGSKKIDDEVYEMVWEDILEENKSVSREHEYLLPRLQWKVLIAIAKEEFVKAPLSREFANKHGLSASSSIARAIKALLDKGLIIQSQGLGLRVYNVFVLKNLQKLY
ncbi:MAG: hypothetical protein U9N53_01880 [Bacteroidota bacterium]|nr:hypothetical protein [Bacteroidota bacterium]